MILGDDPYASLLDNFLAQRDVSNNEQPIDPDLIRYGLTCSQRLDQYPEPGCFTSLFEAAGAMGAEASEGPAKPESKEK